MESIQTVITTVVTQFQNPTLAFMIGGMMLAAMRSELEVPAPVYKFIVTLLLLKVGLEAGIAIREADLISLAVPALFAVLTGVGIVLLGSRTIARMKGVSRTDGLATAGLFGAVSASTLTAGMAVLDSGGIAYEGFIGALYPFMDIAALVTAIVMAKMSAARSVTVQGGGTMALGRRAGTGEGRDIATQILKDTFRSPAVSALLLGIALGVFARPDAVFTSFYEPLFRGLLSVLMLIMGMEAWQRLAELRKVAHAYIGYAIAAPLVHGLIGLGFGVLAHQLTGFSAGGAVLLAVMAASSSDISGPPTIRGALPEANASAYIGASTGIGTPVAILSIPLWVALAGWAIGF